MTQRRNEKKSILRFTTSIFDPAILRNYLKTASRNLRKNAFFTGLNVFGLGLGMSISLLSIAMFTYIYRYDDFHANKDRIYRVITHVADGVDNPSYASAPGALVQKLKEEVTGIESVVAIQRSLVGQAAYQEKKIPINGYFAGPEFLEVFSFPLIQGNARTALNNPNSIVITKTAAAKIFGTKDSMGEVIEIEPYGGLLVTGIFEDVPRNSHMQFDGIVSNATLVSHKVNPYLNNEESWKKFLNSYVYLLLPENADPARIQHYLDEIAVEKYDTREIAATSFELQRFNNITPGPDLRNAIGVSWDYLSLTLAGLITLIILIPACANYINMSISQSLKRMKEIGVRKVMGGQKKQIFFQFIIETTLTMLLALVLSYIIFELIRSEFLEMLAEADTLELTPTFTTIVCFVLFALLVAFAAGVIPAMYFSKIAPVSALKGKPEKSKGIRLPIRQVIITAQFILSLGFVTAVVIILQQYRFSVNYDFGFDQDNIVDVELQGAKPEVLKNEFEKISSVQQISMSSQVLGLGSTSTRYVTTFNQTDSIEAASISIDENFIQNLNLKVLAGRGFGRNIRENTQLVMINEVLMKKLNIPDPTAAIDRFLVLDDGRNVRIAGVLKDFHYTSLREPVGSFFFEYDPNQFAYANLKMAPGHALRDPLPMKTAWKKIGAETEFRWRIFSDEIDEAYSYYFVIIKLWGFLGLLAITVACMGLLGTVVFTVRNRLKEVSIRKVLGASAGNLVFLLSRDFIVLMVIASVITVPAIYFLFTSMLPSIQYYSISIGFAEISVSIIIITVLGLSTIFSQTWKAANTNPVDNLKTE
jgi:putative ABC transport system permease protein